MMANMKKLKKLQTMPKLGVLYLWLLPPLVGSFICYSLALLFLERCQTVTFKIKYISVILLVLMSFGILALYFNWDPSNTALFPKCPFHEVTGIYCPGCGSQRAIHDIINGNLLDGFRHNYLILMVIFVVLYEGYIIFRRLVFKQAGKNLLHNPKVTNTILLLVLLFWVFRNIDFFPFSELAP